MLKMNEYRRLSKQRCQRCGKIRGDHKAGTFACPNGRQFKVGVPMFCSDSFFVAAVTQMAECLSSKQDVEGSTPSRCTDHSSIPTQPSDLVPI